MLSEDEDALICDFAETYHIYDLWALPVETLAVLASGLRDDSRIKMKIAGLNYIPIAFLAPRIADCLSLILYGLSEDAKYKRNVPTMFTDIMAGNTKKENNVRGFASGEEFMAYRARLLNGDK